MTHVTEQSLLRGAVYALEQCGLLLHDANTLYRSGSHATAVAVAAFAREELGRWKLLLSLRREVLGGKQFTVDDVVKKCGNHVAKQKAGMLSTVIRGNTDGGTLIRDMATAEHGSSAWKAAEEKIQQVIQRLRKRTPSDRHEQRELALYVDLVSATEWNRPSQTITQQTARDFINDAVNDYSIQQGQNYNELEILKHRDAELCEALKLWADRPQMTPPEWPIPQ
jgi:AbiV family abortive infection protein